MSGRLIGMKVAALAFGCLLLVGFAVPLSAQVPSASTNRLVVDSIAVEGAQRVASVTILGTLGFEAGDTITLLDVQQAQKALWESSQFSDVQIFARGTGLPGNPATVVVVVSEAPLIRRVVVRGLQRASQDVVADSADLKSNQPYAARKVMIAERAIRNELASNGIPFARIETEQVPLPGRPNMIDLVIEVDEGERVSIAEYVIEGNERISDEEIIGAISQKPEGFWWFRSGIYDADRYESDIADAIPGLFRSRGFIDFQVVSDTLLIDPNTGKARVEVQVDEGPRYRVAQLTVEGNTAFEDEILENYFLPEAGGLLATLGLTGRGDEAELGRVFDAQQFEEVTGPGGAISTLYSGAGYIFADVIGTVEKLPPSEPGGDPLVALTVQIEERSPAFIDEVLIVGNEFTHDRVIRERITVLPGDVYSQDRLIQSIRSIDGLGFFEPVAPGPNFVDVDPATGEVDVTFEVREKQTGTVNFGTSVGGGTGLSGFIGYEQPNLFGQAKSGTVRWDFGRLINSFTVSYTDPAILQSRVSGTATLFNSRDRFFQFTSGRRQRRGGSLRFGFPAPGALRTRLFVGYGLSVTDFDLFDDADDTTLFGRSAGTLSQLTFGVERSTLSSALFPINGTRLSWNVEVNGGVLGGDGQFTKHIVESQLWTPVWAFGGGGTSAPNVVTLGTRLRGGTVVGNVDEFPFERFWMGGVQFGEKLRGYDETSITPLGFFPENSGQISDIDRLGDAFMSISTELALRASAQFTLRSFFDAGNVWSSFDAVNPTDLFRGAGFGTTIITPFGPIGLDYAYGFDKPKPGWQFHFTFGQAGF